MERNLQPNVKLMLDCTDELYEKRSDTQKIFSQEFKELKASLRTVKASLTDAFTEILIKLAKFFPLNEVDVQPTAEQFILQFEHGEDLDQLTGIFSSNEIDLQLSADYYTTQEKLEDQQGREEDSLDDKDYNWILLDGKCVYGEQEVSFQEGVGKQEEDLIDIMKQLNYKWMLLDEQFIYGKQEDLIQERKSQFKKQFIYGAEEIKKRDLLFGWVALLWRCVWLKRKPRIRLK